uniref:Uncharacterized protein n=1 Tax=Hyaloperonospora arabidopsidis (strain Emoy2) TaxID=559515 RepID=M4C265_HYAAE
MITKIKSPELCFAKAVTLMTAYNRPRKKDEGDERKLLCVILRTKTKICFAAAKSGVKHRISAETEAQVAV